MNNKWAIYEIDGYEKINAMLDKHFIGLINAAKAKIREGAAPILEGRNVKREMEYFMESIEGYGASDTEPRSILITSVCTGLGLLLNKETINKIQ